MTDVHIANDNVDPLAMFVDALQSDDDERSLALLHRAAAVRCGAPFEDSIDVHNAWWSCSASLMQPSSNAGLHTSHRTGRFQGFNPQAKREEAAPLHRHVTNQHCFAWPSHHFSSVLEGWCSLCAQASAPRVRSFIHIYSFIYLTLNVFAHTRNLFRVLIALVVLHILFITLAVQVPTCRSCPLTSLLLGVQPVLQLFDWHNTSQRDQQKRSMAVLIRSKGSRASGLLPLTAFLAAAVHQV